MTKDQFISLSKYANDTRNKLNDKEVPAKHQNRENQYREFLKRELSAVTVKLDAAKADGSDKK